MQHQKNSAAVENEKTNNPNRSIKITNPSNDEEDETSVGSIGRTNKLLVTDGFQQVVCLDVGNVLTQCSKQYLKPISAFIGTKVCLNVFNSNPFIVS
jgi:hypothetical protein